MQLGRGGEEKKYCEIWDGIPIYSLFHNPKSDPSEWFKDWRRIMWPIYRESLCSSKYLFKCGAKPAKLFQTDVSTFAATVALTLLLTYISNTTSNNLLYLWYHPFADTTAAKNCCFAAHITATVGAAHHTSMSSTPHEAHHKCLPHTPPPVLS